MLVFGHDRGGRERLDTRLAYRHQVRAGPELFDEADQVSDVVVESERPIGQRHVACIGPVGDVDVMIAQQRRHRVAQQRREMARQRRHHQHLGLGLEVILGEMQQVAERQRQRDLLAHLELLVAAQHPLDPEARPAVGDLGAGEQVHQREPTPVHRPLAERAHPVARP